MYIHNPTTGKQILTSGRTASVLLKQYENNQIKLPRKTVKAIKEAVKLRKGGVNVALNNIPNDLCNEIESRVFNLLINKAFTPEGFPKCIHVYPKETLALFNDIKKPENRKSLYQVLSDLDIDIIHIKGFEPLKFVLNRQETTEVELMNLNNAIEQKIAQQEKVTDPFANFKTNTNVTTQWEIEWILSYLQKYAVSNVDIISDIFWRIRDAISGKYMYEYPNIESIINNDEYKVWSEKYNVNNIIVRGKGLGRGGGQLYVKMDRLTDLKQSTNTIKNLVSFLKEIPFDLKALLTSKVLEE